MEIVLLMASLLYVSVFLEIKTPRPKFDSSSVEKRRILS